MTVKRIQTPTGSHIEPPLDPSWSEKDKLHWHADVVAYETGLVVFIHENNAEPTPYSITVGCSSHASFSFGSAWTFLNGVSTGAAERKRANQ